MCGVCASDANMTNPSNTLILRVIEKSIKRPLAVQERKLLSEIDQIQWHTVKAQFTESYLGSLLTLVGSH